MKEEKGQHCCKAGSLQEGKSRRGRSQRFRTLTWIDGMGRRKCALRCGADATGRTEVARSSSKPLIKFDGDLENSERS